MLNEANEKYYYYVPQARNESCKAGAQQVIFNECNELKINSNYINHNPIYFN